VTDDSAEREASDPASEIESLLEQQVPQDLVFDDDPVEAIVYSGSIGQPSPADVTEMIRAASPISEEGVKAFASILASHPAELNALVQDDGALHRERVLELLLQTSREGGSPDATFLKNFSRCMSAVGRRKDAAELAARARVIQLKEVEQRHLTQIKANPEMGSHLNQFALFLKNELNDYSRAEEYYKRALDLEPADPTYLNNLGVLLVTVPERRSEAEQYFRRSLELQPRDSNSLSNLGTLLHAFGDRNEEAEQVFLNGLSVNASDASLLTNYSALLIERNLWQDAHRHLVRAWEIQNKSTHDKVSARIVFLEAALRALQRADYGLLLGQMRSLFESGMSHSPWSAGATTLERLQEAFLAEDLEFLRALLRSIGDWNLIAGLDRFVKWTAQEPVALMAPLETP